MSTAFTSSSVFSFPELLPDETVYSWCGRVQVWNGIFSALETNRLLFGDRYAGFPQDFPTRLSALAYQMGGKADLGRRLCLTHTLAPYFLANQPPARAECIVSRILNGPFPDLRMHLGIPAARFGGSNSLKRCPRCAAGDEANLGVAYWRLTHQMPSVAICAIHGATLERHIDTSVPSHRRSWLYPWTEIEDFEPEAESMAHAPEAALVRMAALSLQWIECAPGELDPDQLAVTYQNRLQTMGLITAGGSIRMDRLETILRDRLEPLTVARSFREVPRLVDAVHHQFCSLIRPSHKPGHPIKHLLLIFSLFEDWADFSANFDSAKPLERRPAAAAGSTAGPRARNPAEKRFLTLVQREGLSITAAARKLGVTASTGVQWARLHGITYTSRAKHIDPPTLARARLLARRGVDRIQIAGQTGMSIVSVNRLFSSDPKLGEQWRAVRFEKARKDNRKRFLAVRRRHPGLPVKYLRRIPGNGYQWLYRHDREWLVANLPSLWNPAP